VVIGEPPLLPGVRETFTRLFPVTRVTELGALGAVTGRPYKIVLAVPTPTPVIDRTETA
jgi:hypothetical protein